MDATFIEFQKSIDRVKRIRTIYDHLENILHLPHDEISDLLRTQLVNTVSALDRFLHEIVRIGILQTYASARSSTSKFKNFPLTSKTVLKIIQLQGVIPLSEEEYPEYWINKEAIEYLKTFSFQHPDKIKDALSYIWDEEHKWQMIAGGMVLPGATINDKQKYLQQRIILIVERRNRIVHEADIDPFTGVRGNISTTDVDSIIKIIESFAETIYLLVKI